MHLVEVLIHSSHQQPTVEATRGTKVNAQLNIARTGGFTGEVTISPPATKPKGIKVIGDPVVTAGDSVSFRIKVRGGSQSGPNQLVFAGTDSAGRTRAATVTIVVLE